MASATYQQIPWNFTQDYLVWVGNLNHCNSRESFCSWKKNSICWTKEGNITNITGGLVNYSKGKKCNHALPNSNENHLLWCRSRDFVAHIKSSCRRETFDGHLSIIPDKKNISEIVFSFFRPDFRLGCYLLYWLYPLTSIIWSADTTNEINHNPSSPPLTHKRPFACSSKWSQSFGC